MPPVFVLVLGLAAACAPSGSEVSAERPPDLILVIIDTWRWDALGANGSPRPGITPQLDGLARGGFRFSRAFASSPWTMTSVASLLSGQSPTVHGAFGRYREVASIRLGIPLLAEILAGEGYRTLAVVNAPFLSSSLGFGRGFETFDFFPSDNRRSRRAGEAVEVALDLLRGAEKDRPIFLLLHLFDPHLAYDPPPPWNKRWTGSYRGRLRPHKILASKMRGGTFDPTPEDRAYIRALYDGEVAYTDDRLGVFFRQLESVLPARDRWLVVTSDHGEELGEHGGWEHGHSMYRELVQVPLIVVPPASWRSRGGVVDTQVRLLDIMPTLLHAASIERPPQLAGRSLFSLLTDAGEAEDRPVYCEKQHLGSPSTALREDGYTLIVYADNQPSELYDQRADPAETHDLAAEIPDRARLLEERLRALAELLEAQAESLGGPREIQDLDPELRQQLRSLGYLGN